MKKDVSLYNEACGWTIHPAHFGAKSRDEVASDLWSAVQEHLILPLELVQDDPINVRVVTRKLTAREDAEWVAKIVGRLKIPDGVLVLEGGFDERSEKPDFIQIIEVPPGDYQVEVYTLFWGINGEYALRAAQQYEPVGTWFRRTHPGKKFPALLQLHLCENSEEDPGHEAEWDDLYESDRFDDLEAPDVADFIVRLSRWKEDVPLDLPEPKQGWFPIAMNVRKPDLCPIGLRFRED